MSVQLVLFWLYECLVLFVLCSSVLSTVEAKEVKSRIVAFVSKQGVHYPGFFGFQLQSHSAKPLGNVLVCFLYYTLIFVNDDKVIGVTYNLKRLSHPGPPMMLGSFRFYEDRFECFLGVFL